MSEVEAVEARIARRLQTVVELLVRGAYTELEVLTGGRRLRADDIEYELSEYGRTLVGPPETAFSNLYLVPVRGAVPPAYFVRFPLYTKEEGRSDLELQLTLTDHGAGTDMGVELDGILVA